MERITDSPIIPADAYGLIGKAASGSVLLHYAVVRRRTGDQVTTGIEYRQDGDAVSELGEIAAEIRGKWDAEDVLLVRRTGKLAVGEVIALVGVSCPRSKDAFEACQYGVERLKRMKTVRKAESYAQGGGSPTPA